VVVIVWYMDLQLHVQSIHSSLENPTEKRWNMVTHLSIVFAMALMLLVGILGYATFTGYTQGEWRIVRYATLIYWGCAWYVRISHINGITQLRRNRDRRGRDRMVYGFTTTCAISAYHH
jgi:hypothetical protein